MSGPERCQPNSRATATISWSSSITIASRRSRRRPGRSPPAGWPARCAPVLAGGHPDRREVPALDPEEPGGVPDDRATVDPGAGQHVLDVRADLRTHPGNAPRLPQPGEQDRLVHRRLRGQHRLEEPAQRRGPRASAGRDPVCPACPVRPPPIRQLPRWRAPGRAPPRPAPRPDRCVEADLGRGGWPARRRRPRARGGCPPAIGRRRRSPGPGRPAAGPPGSGGRATS